MLKSNHASSHNDEDDKHGVAERGGVNEFAGQLGHTHRVGTNLDVSWIRFNSLFDCLDCLITPCAPIDLDPYLDRRGRERERVENITVQVPPIEPKFDGEERL